MELVNLTSTEFVLSGDSRMNRMRQGGARESQTSSNNNFFFTCFYFLRMSAFFNVRVFFRTDSLHWQVEVACGDTSTEFVLSGDSISGISGT